MTSPLFDMNALMQEYEALGLTSQDLDKQYAQLVSETRNRADETRKRRIRPEFQGFLGAASGYLQPGSSAAEGWMKAMDARQALEEQAPFLDYKLESGYIDNRQKQINDLREKLLSRMGQRDQASAAPYHFMPMAGNVFVGDKRSGQMALVASDKMSEWQKAYDAAYKMLEKEGGKTEAEIAAEAFSSASRLMNQLGVAQPLNMGGVTDVSKGNIQGTVGTPPTATEQKQPELKLDFTPQSVAQLRKNPAAVQRMKEEVKHIPGAADQIDALISGTVGQEAPAQAPTTPTAPSTYVASPQERQYFEKVALPEYEGDKSALSSMNQMDRYLAQMNDILSNPNIGMVSGPLHEQLTTIGGFVNYIDPDAKLAKATQSVPAYFGVLMDVVRDKIKALGSGTAVSNLDLIVSQKSLGDLRNTPEGNKILNGILRLNLAEFQARLKGKVSSFDIQGGRGYREWDKKRLSMDSTPGFTLRRNPNTGEYSVQSRDEWLTEMKSRFPNRSEKEIVSAWKKFSDDQTRKVLTGARQFTKDPIKFQGQEIK